MNPTNTDTLSIRGCAAKTGVSADTIRYYEKIGLLARVPRSTRGHRRFGEDELRWIVFLRRLHETGMPIRRMQQYARLLRRGDATRAERRALLELHRAEVHLKIVMLQGHLRMIDKKISLYGDTEVGAELKPTRASRLQEPSGSPASDFVPRVAAARSVPS